MNDKLKYLGIAAITIASSLFLAASTAKPAPHHDDNPTKPDVCQAGYFRVDIRVYGQRLELGIDAKTHLSNVLTVTQNDPNASPTDQRYIVASACVRPLTNAENQALFDGGQ